jgi:hypothetical protein
MYHLDKLAQALQTWAEEHYDKTAANPNGLRNLIAFFKLCVEWDIQNKQAMAAAAPPGAGPEKMPPRAARAQAPQQAAA